MDNMKMKKSYIILGYLAIKPLMLYYPDSKNQTYLPMSWQ